MHVPVLFLVPGKLARSFLCLVFDIPDYTYVTLTVFFVLESSLQDLESLIHTLSNSIPFLNFKVSGCGSTVPFLDMEITPDTTLCWDSTIFHKPTYRNNYLDYSSRHLFFMKNIARGQFIRYYQQ